MPSERSVLTEDHERRATALGGHCPRFPHNRPPSPRRSRTGGPIWSAAASLPWVGAPLETIRGIAVNADDLTSSTLPQVADIARTLSPDRLRLSPDRVDVARLRRAAPTLQAVNSQATT